MKRMSLSRRMRYIMMCLFFVTGGGIMNPAWSQNNQKVKITGTVYEYDAANKRVPLGFATVSIPDMALGTTSNDRGRYELDGVPTGQVRMNIQYLGKLPIDTLVNVTKDMSLNFTLQNESFKLKEVTVTATNSRSGKSTALFYLNFFSHFFMRTDTGGFSFFFRCASFSASGLVAAM